MMSMGYSDPDVDFYYRICVVIAGTARIFRISLDAAEEKEIHRLSEQDRSSYTRGKEKVKGNDKS